jgi:hypothetical protein
VPPVCVVVYMFCVVRSSSRRLGVAVEHAAALLESVDDVESADGCALAVLHVRDGVGDDALHERLEDVADLIVHDATDALDTTTASETADGGLRDAADALRDVLLLALRALGTLALTTGLLGTDHFVGVVVVVERECLR